MNEIEIIRNLRKIVRSSSALNLNDDVFFDKSKSLVSSIDTYNEKIHYLNLINPELVVKKVIRSSISDIISKGIDPKYLLLSFSCTRKYLNSAKVKSIIKSIDQEQKKYNFFLIGGDTALSFKSSFTICIFSYSNRIIQRNNCFNRDDIYITGNIGDSSVGLNVLKKKIKCSRKYNKYFISKYYKPDLAFGFHKDLYKFASSSMDVSDGLLIDLKKLIGQKNLGFFIDYNQLPKSIYLKRLIKQKKISANKHLFNGDDYQIIFTSKIKYREIIQKYSKKWNQKVTRIGSIVNSFDNYIKFNSNYKKIKDYRGYTHDFS